MDISPLVRGVKNSFYIISFAGKRTDTTFAPCKLSELKARRRSAWNHRGRFRLTFGGAIPPSLDATLRSYFGSKYALNKSPSSVLIEQFTFKNQVVFRRVPAQAGGDTRVNSEVLLEELQSDPLWKDVNITRTPNFYLPKSSAKYGMYFVEFTDNAVSRTLKRVTSTPTYLNGELCFAVKTYDNSPPAPQCSLCLRWGHRTHLCRSPTKRCWKCGGNHDERDHARTCGDCKRNMNTTGHCPCSPSCYNCREAHRADSHDCMYYQHRRDRIWIRDHPVDSLEAAVKKGKKVGKAKEKVRGKEGEPAMAVD